LPWPGKRQALKSAQEARSQMLLIEEQTEILKIEHLVVQIAARIAGLKEMAKHVGERRHRFEMLRKSLAARPQLSPIQQVERGLIENQLRMLERGIVMLETEQHTLERSLSIWLGEAVELKMNWDHVPALQPREEWEAKVAEQNPELQKISAEKKVAEAELKSAELAAYPDWQVGANYREERMAPTNHFYHAMVGITLPIFDRGQHKESMAKAEIKAVSAREEFTRQQILAQISQAWEEAHAHSKLLKTFNHNLIKESEKRFHIAEVEFSKGRIDAPTFLATDAQIHESVDASFQTTLDALAAINRLRLMVGLSPEI
jgi:outer membrane protein TolC